ncbi:MAG: CZB domain-containing protein [Methylotenera sp.]|uniref:CZB domain-containing protein n=1 Tax=Methylotenera sp. TaxID=2051956 RepID=UPI00185A22C4|nr:CZB domain-containing protein [Methylotenera sp.]NOU25141.1 CZB domain-containing protein [Methylotenera sp.]
MLQVDFVKMINIHVALKRYLTDLLSNQTVVALDYQKIKKDDVCYLGKLIYGHEQQLATLPVFEEVKGLHANFHGLTAEIVRLHHAGQHEKALLLLHGRFEMVFRKLKSRIIVLSQQYTASTITSVRPNRPARLSAGLHAPHF